jgi:hypothetical protein
MLNKGLDTKEETDANKRALKVADKTERITLVASVGL